jgi:hypothetical protein
MIGNVTLADWQQQVLSGEGLEVCPVRGPEGIRESHCLVTYDDVFFTRRVLRSLLREARGASESLRCGLPAASLLVGRTRALQDLEEAEAGGTRLALYRLFVLQAESPVQDAAGLAAELRRARPVRAEFKEKILTVPTPKNIMGDSAYRHPLTSSVVMHLGHWVHVLWANQLSVQIHWVQTILDHKAWTAWKLLEGSLQAVLSRRWSRPGFRHAWMGRLNRIGRRCDIHPTARLEFAQLGDGVRVGAFALIRGSLVGEGSVLEDRVNLQYSVIGPGSFMSRNASMALCAGYPGGNLSIRGVQASLFGRDCAMTSAGVVLDLRTQGEVQVATAGGLKSVGTNFLGACFGHRTFLGADVHVNSGRQIPNGVVLIKAPGEVLSTIPPDLPPGMPAWVKDGTAVTGRKD